MQQRSRGRFQLRIVETLEGRRLLAAPVVAGNLGRILQSQFQPYGFRTTVGSQWDGVRLGGRLQVDVASSPFLTRPGISTPINTGLIDTSQFNGGGFGTIGLQFQRVRIGGGLTVFGSDHENSEVSSPRSVATTNERIASRFRTVVNKGAIAHSQFNDGGFGVLDLAPDGKIVSREGRVGLQWRKSRVGGPVDVGVDVLLINPGAASSQVAAAATPGTTTIDPSTNTGRIRDSQFNDGGFGDIGMQWSQVAVGRRVATSSNTLFIQPRQDDGAPITVRDRTFGQRNRTLAAGLATGTGSGSPRVRAAAASTPDSSIPSTDTNAATNSGQIIGSQFNDGGFGDVGLQWKKVRVRGEVTTVHNSLTVQPENRGQGLITLQRVRFPAVPPVTPRTLNARPRPLPTDPAAISDGDPVKNLPTPTGPLSPFFPTPVAGNGTVVLPFPGNFPLVNAATNSGLIRGGQFSAGGFGDDGLQWLNVDVAGNVRVVHNSLSVHPEGSRLAGISVADVAYGNPVSRQVARRLAVIKSLVISPDAATTSAPAATPEVHALTPPNNRDLTDQQLAATSGTDVFLQWNGIDHRRGLVVAHNIIKITGVGPTTGPITLSNIRFPFKTPLGPLVTTAPTVGEGTVQAQAQARDVAPVLLNAADNSGYLNHAQFSVGGFGDDGLQWRNDRVGGSVEVVHNTLAVDASADLPPGDVAGPITVSNVTFNSGALRGDFTTRRTQTLVSPPDITQRRSSRPIDFGHALPQDPAVKDQATNSGILKGGQLAAGGANHTLLQWQGVRTSGPVKVIDNILSISVLDRPAGPITISDVTFA